MSSNNSGLIRDYCDAEVFLALKKICRYIVDDAWKTLIGIDEIGAEYSLAIAKSKRHESDIIMLANLDVDLTWGCKKEKTDKGFITIKVGDFNPWYNGKLSLEKFLESIQSLAEFIEFSEPRQIMEAEFLHFYNYLRYILIPAESLKKAPLKTIDFNSLHPKIKEHCQGRYSSKNYSDAIFTAYKVIFQEIKDLTGIRDMDGKPLAEKAFALNNPIIRLNDLVTESEQNEQKGFMLLLGGAYVGIRDPKAHDLIEQGDEYRTLQYLSFASLLLERIDERKSVDLSVLAKNQAQKHRANGMSKGIDPPYVYINGSFGGNGDTIRFQGCVTYNLSDTFVFIEKIKIIDAVIPFTDTLVKSGDSIHHSGLDGLAYPATDNSNQTLKIYFHSRNHEKYVSTHKLKFQKRQDGKYNIVGIDKPIITKVKEVSK